MLRGEVCREVRRHYLVQLARLAVRRDEGIVGGSVGGEALLCHPFVHVHSLPGLVAHVIADHERVICPKHRLYTLQHILTTWNAAHSALKVA